MTSVGPTAASWPGGPSGSSWQRGRLNIAGEATYHDQLTEAGATGNPNPACSHPSMSTQFAGVSLNSQKQTVGYAVQSQEGRSRYRLRETVRRPRRVAGCDSHNFANRQSTKFSLGMEQGDPRRSFARGSQAGCETSKRNRDYNQPANTQTKPSEWKQHLLERRPRYEMPNRSRQTIHFFIAAGMKASLATSQAGPWWFQTCADVSAPASTMRPPQLRSVVSPMVAAESSRPQAHVPCRSFLSCSSCAYFLPSNAIQQLATC